MERKEYRQVLNDIAENSRIEGEVDRCNCTWNVETFLATLEPSDLIGVLENMTCYEDVMNDLTEKMASNLVSEILSYENLQKEIKRFYPEGYEEEKTACK